jgi:hypothetical protein
VNSEFTSRGAQVPVFAYDALFEAIAAVVPFPAFLKQAAGTSLEAGRYRHAIFSGEV